MTARGEQYDLVVPTVGRPSLAALLSRLDTLAVTPSQLLVVDDRPRAAGRPRVDDRPRAAGRPRVALSPLSPLDLGEPGPALAGRCRVLVSGGRGPAAARNVGWRHAAAAWTVFLDDDVLPGEGWAADLAADLAGAGPEVGALTGRIVVPLPPDRRPTDWERNTAGLARARLASADLAVRRSALLAVAGFDERFRRAFREDADLAMRLTARGWAVAGGSRVVRHPVRRAPWTVSVTVQRGNRDDARMERLHGRGWYVEAAAPLGTRPRHLATSAALVGGAAALAAGHARAGALAIGTATALTATFAAERIAPGPPEVGEVGRMLLTSVLIPPVASWHYLAGRVAVRRERPLLQRRPPAARPPAARPLAVLLDRDGTVIEDVPYNRDPELVRPIAGAAEALGRLRRAGLALALVSNQSGVARRLITAEELEAVNARVEAVLGPFGAVVVCPHGEEEGCGCRKPAPGLVLEAARRLAVPAARCVVIGDIAADVAAARAAGATGILVPGPATLPGERNRAPLRAPSLAAAVDLVLAGS